MKRRYTQDPNKLCAYIDERGDRCPVHARSTYDGEWLCCYHNPLKKGSRADLYYRYNHSKKGQDRYAAYAIRRREILAEKSPCMTGFSSVTGSSLLPCEDPLSIVYKQEYNHPIPTGIQRSE
jgi:hypothetical protein